MRGNDNYDGDGIPDAVKLIVSCTVSEWDLGRRIILRIFQVSYNEEEGIDSADFEIKRI